MLYNYDNLLNAVREIKTNKTIAENERTMNKRNKLLRLENELKSSGILDDWYDLKRTCRELNIRFMPFGGWNESKCGPLMDDYQYFEDNGTFSQCVSSGSHWRDMFGFSYKNREFRWKIWHTTTSTLFNGFENEDTEIDTKIKLIELFMYRYEEYRTVQLQRIYTKIGQTMEETMAIKKCNSLSYNGFKEEYT